MPVRMRPVIVLNLKLTNPLKGGSEIFIYSKIKRNNFCRTKKQNVEVCDATKLLVAPMPVIKKSDKPFKTSTIK